MKRNKKMEMILNAIRSWIYPPTCILCRDILPVGTELLLCGRCRPSQYALNGERCVICSRKVLRKGDKCYSCIKYENWIPGHASFEYRGAMALALRDFKYMGMKTYAETFARMMVRERKNTLPEPFFLVPVPIHRSRLKERGYNQALELARCLGEILQVPVVDCLIRKRRTRALKKLGAGERRSSMSHVLEIKEGSLPEGTAVIIDDIYTSGSTVESCAAVLRRKFPSLKVCFWTFSIRE